MLRIRLEKLPLTNQHFLLYTVFRSSRVETGNAFFGLCSTGLLAEASHRCRGKEQHAGTKVIEIWCTDADGSS